MIHVANKMTLLPRFCVNANLLVLSLVNVIFVPKRSRDVKTCDTNLMKRAREDNKDTMYFRSDLNIETLNCSR